MIFNCTILYKNFKEFKVKVFKNLKNLKEVKEFKVKKKNIGTLFFAVVNFLCLCINLKLINITKIVET